MREKKATAYEKKDYDVFFEAQEEYSQNEKLERDNWFKTRNELKSRKQPKDQNELIRLRKIRASLLNKTSAYKKPILESLFQDLFDKKVSNEVFNRRLKFLDLEPILF